MFSLETQTSIERRPFREVSLQNVIHRKNVMHRGKKYTEPFLKKRKKNFEGFLQPEELKCRPSKSLLWTKKTYLRFFQRQRNKKVFYQHKSFRRTSIGSGPYLIAGLRKIETFLIQTENLQNFLYRKKICKMNLIN